MVSALFLLINVGQGPDTGQQPSVKPRSNVAAIQADTRPVTCSEAVEVFNQARTILAKRLKENLPKTTIQKGDQPVSREQIVAELNSIRKGVAPAVRFTLPAVKYDPKVLKIDGSEKSALETLIADGYVGRVGVLATGPRDSLTLKQLGDTLGLFMSRVAEVTHPTSEQYSPNLGAGSSN